MENVKNLQNQEKLSMSTFRICLLVSINVNKMREMLETENLKNIKTNFKISPRILRQLAVKTESKHVTSSQLRSVLRVYNSNSLFSTLTVCFFQSNSETY